VARLTLAPLVASLSGRMDGLTVRMTRNGPVMQKAQDTPPYTDDASMAVKDRFGMGVHVWATMPRSFRDILSADHTKAGRGSPGPWITAWSKYALTNEWNYPYGSDHDHVLTIFNAYLSIGYWYFEVSGGYKPDYTKVFVLVFHPDLYIDPRRWFVRNYISSGTKVTVSEEDMPPGSSCLLLPKHDVGEDYVGVGDAYPLPTA